MTFLRPAIAMIELIFAIVIIGIVMMSAPMLISTATQSGYIAIQQESINEAATQVNMILSYPWDENNTNNKDVVLATLGDSNLSEVGTSGVRAGTPIQSYRKYVLSTNATRYSASIIGSDAGDLDDIDDFDNTNINLTNIQTSTKNYIETTTVNIMRHISYMKDNLSVSETGTYRNGGDSYTNTSALSFTPFLNALNTTSNIKHIQVTLTSSSGTTELNKTIILHAFSCNIGNQTLEERP